MLLKVVTKGENQDKIKIPLTFLPKVRLNKILNSAVLNWEWFCPYSAGTGQWQYEAG